MNISLSSLMIMGILAALIVLAILTVVFRWLWNSTMPDVFALKSLSFWQAFKILLISSILFGGSTSVIQQSQTAIPAAMVTQTSPE